MLRFKIILFLVVAVGLICPGFADDTCPYAYSPDGGSEYDLRDIAEQTHFYATNFNGVTYNFDISICSASAGVCQYPAANPKKCLGNSWTRQVIGLNGGAGVQIKYSKGDISTDQETVITLLCDNSNLLKNVVLADPGQPSVNYFNGTIYCTAPLISTVAKKEKLTTASSNNDGKHFKVQYSGFNYQGQTCNASLTSMYLISTIFVDECTPGCAQIGNAFTLTECDQPVVFPYNTSWIQVNSYTGNFCAKLFSSYYLKANQCDTWTGFARQTCDSTTVYAYSCNGPDCTGCELVSKTRTNVCDNGYDYQCIPNNATPVKMYN